MSDPRLNLSEGEFATAEAMSPAVSRYRLLLSSRNSPSSDDSSRQVRLDRHEQWVRAASASLVDRPDAKTICTFWSDAADRILSEAFHTIFPANAALFALGKLGARELNLSSDVDILIVTKENFESSDLRRFQKLLADNTPEGFALRLDFDLRPGGRFGPLMPTVDQLVDYYGNYGETWERMAFVRLRPIAGDPEIHRKVMEFTARFSFRRHLDFNLLEDLRQLRSRIHHEPRNDHAGVHLKLSTGGIRDIELFIHALQVIHGGKDPSLRLHGTEEAARALMNKGILPQKDGDFLINLYWDLRRLENHTQAFEDHQTHLLHLTQNSPESLRVLAQGLSVRMDACDQLVSTLIGAPAPPTKKFSRDHLPDHLRETVDEIMATPILSRHRERDERLKSDVVNKFLEILESEPGSADLALATFRDFLRSVRAKTDFFALLAREEKLLHELAWLFGMSRYLGRLLCFRPELLDAFVFRAQELREDDLGLLLEDLAEKRLLAEIIEGSAFLRSRDLSRAQAVMTSTADEIVNTLTRVLRREIPSDVRVLALGKWGAKEAGFRSDLDLIFVSEDSPSANDLKFAKRLISRLTEPHRGGSIYPVDMRLRPSGKAGPLVMTQTDLVAYLQKEAAPWERQAYLRARWVDGEICDFPRICQNRGLSPEELLELGRIQTELSKTARGLDLKLHPGGLADLELFAQTLVLLEKTPAVSMKTSEILKRHGHQDIAEIYDAMRQAEQCLQLVASESRTDYDKKHESSHTLAAMLNQPTIESLEVHLSDLLQRSQAQLLRLDPRQTKR